MKIKREWLSILHEIYENTRFTIRDSVTASLFITYNKKPMARIESNFHNAIFPTVSIAMKQALLFHDASLQARMRNSSSFEAGIRMARRVISLALGFNSLLATSC